MLYGIVSSSEHPPPCPTEAVVRYRPSKGGSRNTFVIWFNVREKNLIFSILFLFLFSSPCALAQSLPLPKSEAERSRSPDFPRLRHYQSHLFLNELIIKVFKNHKTNRKQSVSKISKTVLFHVKSTNGL